MTRMRAATAVLLFVVIIASPALAAAAPVSVPAAVVMTMDGSQTIWTRRSGVRRPVASTIKMLNALVVRERASLDETVTVTRQAARINDGDVGLYAGQVLTVRQLLDMMLVASANDAAEALAIHIAGSRRAYVALMNAKAAQLGLTRTHAVDPHGLSKREHSTAADLVVIARAVMADPVLRRVVSKTRVWVPRRSGYLARYRSTNHLLGHYAGIEGVKTGYTRPAGFCLVSVARRGDVELIAVVLGARSNPGRFREMRRLLNYGFAHYKPRPSLTPTLPSMPTTPSVTPSETVTSVSLAF